MATVPAARFFEIDGAMVDLSTLTDALRHKVEIRNRSSMKRLHCNCFVGSAAVTALVSSGSASSRDKAVAIGQALVEKGFIKHVTDPSTRFKDGNMCVVVEK